MKDVKKICKIAVIQAAPVMFDKDACTQKAVDLIQEASRRGAQLMVFPELFIPVSYKHLEKMFGCLGNRAAVYDGYTIAQLLQCHDKYLHCLCCLEVF